jgi:hypothetical protein
MKNDQQTCPMRRDPPVSIDRWAVLFEKKTEHGELVGGLEHE